MTKATVAAMLLLMNCGTSSVIGSAEAIPVTICELMAAPRNFDGRRVSVVAQIESDGIEHTTLIDESCPERGVTPYVPENSRANPDMMALQETMFRGRPGTNDKRVTASFKGVFRRYPNRMPSRRLILESVTDLHIEPRN